MKKGVTKFPNHEKVEIPVKVVTKSKDGMNHHDRRADAAIQGSHTAKMKKLRQKNPQNKKFHKFIVMFGDKIKRAFKPKKEKVIIPLPAYRAVKLTAKLDSLRREIDEMDGSDPKLYALKVKRDIIKKKLN